MSTLQCKACNTLIPVGARFCGRCGKPTDVDQAQEKQLWADHAPSIIFPNSDLAIQQGSWNWQQVEEAPTLPFPPENALLPLLGASMGPAPGNVPMVHGSPQIGGVPSLQGTSQGPGGAMTQAPWQQPPAGASGTSAPPNAPSSSAPMQPSTVSSPHHQHQMGHHQHHPSHHLHHSGHLRDSGELHS